jgi:hypothetical protein
MSEILLGVTQNCHCEERSDVAISIIISVLAYYPKIYPEIY